jgi:hypothetical protein
MGFFKKALGGGGSSLIGAGVGAAYATNPWLGAAVGLGVGGAAGNFLGFGGEAESGLRGAGAIEQAALLQAMRFQEQALQEGKPFREAAVGALGQLQERVDQPLGESRRFQQNLQAALGGQQAGLARFGLTDSSTAALGSARLTSNLASQEEAERLAILQGLSGGALTGFGPALGGLQLQGGLAGRLAQTQANIGSTQAAGRQSTIQTGLDIAGLFVGAGRGGSTPKAPNTPVAT